MCDKHSADLERLASSDVTAGPFYSLWDVDTGNCLGTFPTEEEVLSIVRALIEANGLSYADDLDLSIEEGEGPIWHVASGDTLMSIAMIDQRTSVDHSWQEMSRLA